MHLGSVKNKVSFYEGKIKENQIISEPQEQSGQIKGNVVAPDLDSALKEPTTNSTYFHVDRSYSSKRLMSDDMFTSEILAAPGCFNQLISDIKSKAYSSFRVEITDFEFKDKSSLQNLCEAINANPNIKELNLTRCNLQGNLELLCLLSNLNSLGLQGNSLFPKDADHLRNLKLQTLNLNENNLQEWPNSFQLPSLLTKNLKTLNIRSNNLGTTGCYMLRHLTQLEHLDISNNSIKPGMIESLKSLLPKTIIVDEYQ